MKYLILEIIKKYKHYFIGGIAIVIFLVSFILFRGTEEIINEPMVLATYNEPEEESTTIKVDIKGAVVNPGIYEMEIGSRVGDVIKKSGGLTPDGDTSMINLARLLTDEMVIIIYTKEEIAEFRENNRNTKCIDEECICPGLPNDGCLTNGNGEVVDNTTLNPRPPQNQDTNQSNGLISINTASLNQLMTLTGIGESRARAIIEYREANNGFMIIEEIMNVSGIGAAIFENIRNHITI